MISNKSALTMITNSKWMRSVFQILCNRYWTVGLPIPASLMYVLWSTAYPAEESTERSFIFLSGSILGKVTHCVLFFQCTFWFCFLLSAADKTLGDLCFAGGNANISFWLSCAIGMFSPTPASRCWGLWWAVLSHDTIWLPEFCATNSPLYVSSGHPNLEIQERRFKLFLFKILDNANEV